MNQRRYRRLKLARKLLVIVAAAPLLQFAQCATFNRQVFANVANNSPNVLYLTLQQIALAPFQLLFDLSTLEALFPAA
ncbi:MAG: hypothetical protein MI923_09950 [Phycisphaerales bacterium]|nr:hypothetical protein [Phycisphaerales bacterium]